jgi:Tfp pilus assembly protein PilV
MKTRKRPIAAFSLVELTIALGVISFCLLTIIGLLAIGINSTHSSTTQTAATNLLTAVTSDLEAAPNITPSYSQTFSSAKGTVPSPGGVHGISGSPVYGLTLPAGASATLQTYKFYVGENGITNSSAAASLYQINIWISPAGTSSNPTHQETFARVLISWPASAAYANAQGYVENVVAINRT